MASKENAFAELKQAMEVVGNCEYKVKTLDGDILFSVHAGSNTIMNVRRENNNKVFEKMMALIRPILEDELSVARDRLSTRHQEYLDASAPGSARAGGVTEGGD